MHPRTALMMFTVFASLMFLSAIWIAANPETFKWIMGGGALGALARQLKNLAAADETAS